MIESSSKDWQDTVPLLRKFLLARRLVKENFNPFKTTIPFFPFNLFLRETEPSVGNKKRLHFLSSPSVCPLFFFNKTCPSFLLSTPFVRSFNEAKGHFA